MSLIQDILDRHPESVLHQDPASLANLISIERTGDLWHVLTDLILLGAEPAILAEVSTAYRSLSGI